MAEAAPHCLIAHPDVPTGERAAAALSADGWRVSRTASAATARDRLERGGFEMLVAGAERAELFAPKRVPAIALLAAGDSPGQLLDLGADAVCGGRPLREIELCVRARALIRGPHAPPGVRLRADVPRHRVTLDGVELALTPKEFALLTALLGAPGELLSRAALSHYIWGASPPRRAGRALDAHVRRLRCRLGPAGPLIQTVWGLGYRLAPPCNQY